MERNTFAQNKSTETKILDATNGLNNVACVVVDELIRVQ